MKNLNHLMHRLTLVVLILLTLSCDNEDFSITSRESLIVMKANYFANNASVDQVIVVTDLSGKVLGKVKSTPWVDTPIYAQTFGYNGDVVNVYIISYSSSYHFIHAFLNLKRGSEFDGPVYEFNSPQVEAVQLQLTNIEPFDRLTVSSDFAGFTIEQIADTAGRQRTVYAEGGRVLGQVVSNGEGRYGFFDIDKQTGTAAVDFSALREPSLKSQIKLDPRISYSNFRMTASFDPNSERWGYELFSTWSSNTPQFDVYYPATSFAKYVTSFDYSLDGKHYSEQREAPTLNLEYEEIAFNCVVTNADPRQFKMEASGAFDYYTVTYSSGSADNAFIRVFNSHRYGEFSIPDFSTIEGVNKFPFSSLTSVNIELVDEDGPEENEKYFKYFTSGKMNLSGNRKAVSLTLPIK